MKKATLSPRPLPALFYKATETKIYDCTYFGFAMKTHAFDDKCRFARWARQCGGETFLDELRRAKDKAESTLTSGAPTKSAKLRGADPFYVTPAEIVRS